MIDSHLLQTVQPGLQVVERRVLVSVVDHHVHLQSSWVPSLRRLLSRVGVEGVIILGVALLSVILGSLVHLLGLSDWHIVV